MIGAICRQDILTHPVITIRCFGWRVFLKALLAGQDRTFLSVLAETPALQPAPGKVPELVERCIALESCAKGIYESLARRFDQPESAKAFFETIARQEEDHAELLGLCRAAAARGEWDGKHFDPWRDALPGLEKQMREAESRADSLTSLPDALRLVIQIESSEVNRVYLAVVASSDSDFVRALRVFHQAGLEHISHICECIPEMHPESRNLCRELRDEYSRALAQGCQEA